MAAVQVDWTEVDSSNVTKVGYHKATKTLCVAFHNGGLYSYDDVPADIAMELVYSNSVGAYLNKIVKGVHAYTKHFSDADLDGHIEHKVKVLEHLTG